MKLARPDIFHPRIVLAGCAHDAAGDGDDAGLVSALRHRGLHARWLPWDDPDVRDADLVILRTTHDYAVRLDEFLAWTTGVANLLNAPAVVAWNADRRYLRDLAGRGVPTVPGAIFAPGEALRMPGTGDVFVGRALGTGTHRCTEATALGYAAELHTAAQSVVVQPADAAPENVLVFIGGEPSHAFTRQESALVQAEPDFEIWDVGAAALAAAAAQVGIGVNELLYARAHLSGSRLLELQLVDPSLDWLRLDAGTRENAQRNFALAVESACERLGLGPFSRRSP